MPRPGLDVTRVRAVLVSYLAIAETADIIDTPITIRAAVRYLKQRRIAVHRATLDAHGLTTLIAEAKGRQRAASQRKRGASTALDAADERFTKLRVVLDESERRNRALLGRLQLAEHNARLEGWDPNKLWRPMQQQDRSRAHLGGGRRRGAHHE